MIAFPTGEARDYCRAVIRRAKERGMLPPLLTRLQYLARYSNTPGGYYSKHEGANTRCLMYKDRAELSFEFVMQRREADEAEWRNWFYGGLIFHGESWGVHT